MTYKKLDSTPGTTGQGHDIGQDKIDAATALANQKAIEALQLLLQKLPDKTAAVEAIRAGNPAENDVVPVEKERYKQYPIPSDSLSVTSVPPFKPLAQITGITTTYRVKLGPYEAVTEALLKNAIAEDSAKYVYDQPVHPLRAPQHTTVPRSPPPQPPSQYASASAPGPVHLPPPKRAAPAATPLIANPAIASAAAANAANSLAGPHAYIANTPPLNLYHTMSMKHKGQGFVARAKDLDSHPPPPPPAPLRSHSHSQSLVRGPPATIVYQPLEITKSIAYEI